MNLPVVPGRRHKLDQDTLTFDLAPQGRHKLDQDTLTFDQAPLRRHKLDQDAFGEPAPAEGFPYSFPAAFPA